MTNNLINNNLSQDQYSIFSILLNNSYALQKLRKSHLCTLAFIYDLISLACTCKEINIIFNESVNKLFEVEILNDIILYSGLDVYYIKKCIVDIPTFNASLKHLGDELIDCYYTKKIIHTNYYKNYIRSLCDDNFYILNNYITKNYSKYKEFIIKIENLSLIAKIALHNAEKPRTLINNLLYNLTL